jgi:4-hydroxy-2-oxoheptanedioate aldolase
MTTVSGDTRLLAAAAAASVAKFRDLVGQAATKAEKGAY